MNTGSWVLAVETSTRRGSVALGRIVATGPAAHAVEIELAADRPVTSDLLPAIQRLLAARGLAPADLGVVAFSAGPGSFTGLRIAATVARMLAATLECRVVAVPTLEVIAAAALAAQRGNEAPDGAAARDPQGTLPRNALAPGPTRRVAVLCDARRGRCFGAAYEAATDGELTLLRPVGLYEAAELLAGLATPLIVAGDAAEAQRAACEAAGAFVVDVEQSRPTAGQLLRQAAGRIARGQFCAAAEVVPIYVRPPECEEVYEERRAAARARHGATGVGAEAERNT